jgi:hypothetical protein
MALAANGWPSPSTAWKEVPLVGEPALFEDFADDIVAYQKKDAAENGPLRGFHAKIHAGFIADGADQIRPLCGEVHDTPGARNHGNDRSSFDE